MTKFSRRTWLGGAAVSIGLPFLSSLFERKARAADCAPRQRFLAFFLPCGIHMPDWTPTTTGKGWAMPYILQPLEPVRDKLVVLTGLDHDATAYPARPPGQHAAGTGSFLTMLPVHENENDPRRTSLDQKIAAATSACNRPLSSLQLGVKADGDGCDGASCPHVETITWNKNTPLPAVTTPQTAFDRIFAGFDPAASSADSMQRQARRSSVLDYVLADAASLKTELSAGDGVKLDEFTTGIRELEQRIQNLASSSSCQKPAAPSIGEEAPYEQRVDVMLELMALAFQCDATRVMTFMLARGTSMIDFRFLLGEPSQHHILSHHKSDPAVLEKLKQIGHWEMTQAAKLLQRLDSMVEDNGKTVLDNSIVYLSSEIGDGNTHPMWDTPTLIAGSGGGKLKIDGSHHNYLPSMTFPRPLVGPKGGPHTIKAFVSMMNAFGLPDTTFGDGSASGALPELLV